jgi:hypothetical protein
MLDPNFDPLAELQEQGDLINKLIMAHNRQDQLLVEMSTQHKAAVDLIRTDRKKIVALERKIHTLENLIKTLV